MYNVTQILDLKNIKIETLQSNNLKMFLYPYRHDTLKRIHYIINVSNAF